MKLLLVDMTNLARKNAFASVKADPYDNGVWAKWSERVICDIFDFIEKFEANRCILAMDSLTYWRTNVFPEYKSRRRKFKEGAIIDFDSLDAFYEKFMKRFSEIFPNIYCLCVDKCEADDLIAVITKYHANGMIDSSMRITETIIVSADKDFNQLKKYLGVIHYNPITRREVTVINPQRELDIKVICGDSNDDVPPIRKGIGIKTAEKIINSHQDIPNSSDTLLVENFRRNKILIDFDFIPKEIQGSIIYGYSKACDAMAPVAMKSVFPFFMEFHAPLAIEKWQKAKERILKLS